VADDEAARAVTREFLAAPTRSRPFSNRPTSTDSPEPGSSTPNGVSVDLLFASSGIEPDLVGRSERLEIAAGVWLLVASVGDLIALKLLAVDDERATDRADLRGLSGIATGVDWAVANDAVEQIQVRGFNRGRDLTAALADLRND
jgi:hypothetical protein